ncbi:MAG: lipopolysaccharide heptosyltransferase II [Burkholderiales bacterium]
MRTLIVAPDSLADAVMTQPLAALLRRLDPGGRIDVLASPAVAAVFEAFPGVGTVFTSRHAFGPVQPWGKFLLARRLDRQRHDRVFVLPGSKRAALVPWLARIPIRIGLQNDTRWGMINQPHAAARTAGDTRGAEPPARPAVERYAHLAFDPSQPLPGQIPNPVLERHAGRESLARHHAGLPQDTRLIALCVAAEDGPSRRWPARHWASLVSLAAREWPGFKPVLLGGAGDRAFATEVAALTGGAALNLCGIASLADTIALVAQAEAVVAHDCGLMHVAAAYSRPMVAVFGPTDPRFAPPRSPRAKVEWLHQPCSPCTEPLCRHVHGRCTVGIRPEVVLGSLKATARLASRDIR